MFELSHLKESKAGWWGYDPGGEDGFGKSMAGENGEGRVMWSMQTQDMDVVSISGGCRLCDAISGLGGSTAVGRKD